MDILKDIDLVIFDFDGTIADLDINWAQLRQSLKIDESQKIGDVIQDYAVTDHPNLAIVSEAEISGLKNNGLRQTATKVISQLVEEGYKVAIFTRNSRKVVELALMSTSFRGKLKIVGREDVLLLKPNPQGIHMLMESSKAQPNKTVLIGDTYHDIESAHSAGVRSVIVHNLRNDYQPQGADYYIDDLSQLIEPK